MINQNYLFPILLLKIELGLIITLNLKFEKVSFTKFKKILTIKQRKYVGGSSAVSREWTEWIVIKLIKVKQNWWNFSKFGIIFWTPILIQQYENMSGYGAGGYMLKRIG